MKRRIFKKQNVMDTAVSVAIGGGANVAIDFALSQIPQMATVDQKYIDLGKFAVGVVGSSMIGNKYVKDAMNGVAVVGISNFAKSFMAEQTVEKQAGVPEDTIGAIGRRNRLPLRSRNKLQQLAERAKVGGTASAFIG